MGKTAEKTLEYEQRLILFLDFLGFRAIVKETVASPTRLKALLRAIGFLSELKPDEADVGKSITQFSDSVVVSYPVTETSSVFNLLFEVALMIIDLAYAGYLLRGAITVGKLIHTDEYLVGPAMIRAYEMESRDAKVPRVLIDPAVVNIARTYHAWQNSPAEEAAYVRGMMTKDEDGRYFYDYVSWHSVVAVAGGDADLYDAYLENLGTLVDRGLRNKDPQVKEKYLWLHRRYVASIDEILRQPENSEWYAENQALVAVAKTLPRHEVLARRARRAVAASVASMPDARPVRRKSGRKR